MDPFDNSDDKSVASVTSDLTKDKRDATSGHGSSSGLGDHDMARGKTALDEQEKLVSRETAAIHGLRRIVFGVVVLVALIGSLGAYFLVETEERKSGEASFREQANEIDERAHAKLSDAVASLRALSKTITASAITQGATFPFYSLPFYGE